MDPSNPALTFLVLVVCCVLLRVHSRPTGAPSAACGTMHPNHPGARESDHSSSPFSIQHEDTYTPGSINTITIQSSDPSRTIGGILLQARTIGSRVDASGIVGIWLLLPKQNDCYQLLQCTSQGDTITHRKINNDTSVSFFWVSPNDLSGNIEFLVTVAENFSTFWVQLTSGQTVRHVDEPVMCSPADYCSNGGTCEVSDNGDQSCLCAPGYTGDTCEEALCLGEDFCGEHGECRLVDGQDKCFCRPPYTGNTCDIRVTACTSSPCLFGVCNVGANDTYECECPPGRAGDRCEIAVCDPVDYCRNGGTCEVSTMGDNVCSCAPGYDGPSCETAVCVPTDYCSNGGTCEVNANGDYVCTCISGFTGATCEEDVDECVSGPCMNNGACVNGINEYQCQCNTGFSGPICEQYCTSDFTCENNGRCVYQEDLRRVQCDCSPGFVGVRCQFAVTTDATGPPGGIGGDRGPPVWWLVLAGLAVVFGIVCLAGCITARCQQKEHSSSR